MNKTAINTYKHETFKPATENKMILRRPVLRSREQADDYRSDLLPS